MKVQKALKPSHFNNIKEINYLLPPKKAINNFLNC